MKNLEYEYYAMVNQWDSQDPFYNNNMSNKVNDTFTIPKISNEWTTYITPYWYYVMNKKQIEETPDQGWKIHITTNIKDSQFLLFDIAKYLIQKNISFKFIPNIRQLEIRNEKYADRSESGKFITIYPENDSVFLNLLDRLKQITDNYDEGPYILNDKSWKQSNVFYRYGGFAQMTDKNDKGEEIYVIKDNNGNNIEDMRVPYYYLPEFVTEPDKIKNNIFKIPEEDLKEFNKYKIKNAIHFSNAGGVYKVTKDSKDYLMKEGRKEAGIDNNNLDGFSRINKEYKFLSMLNNVNGIVSVHNKFNVWKSNYLIEDLIDGIDLDSYITNYYPLIHDKFGSIDLRKSYAKNSISIIKKIINIVNETHNLGIAIGDLQPANIIYNPTTEDVKIIDLENANFSNQEYHPGLQTPSFAPKKVNSFNEADWFAVKCIAYNLFMPNLVSPTLSSKIFEAFKIKIREEFGSKTIKFLEYIDRFIDGKLDFSLASSAGKRQLNLPDVEISLNNTNILKKNIYNGIINNLNPNSFKLIRGTFRQKDDDISEFNIENGAFGVLMSIFRYNNYDKNNIDYIKIITPWLNKILPFLKDSNTIKSSDSSMFNGLSGICSVLYDLGKNNESIFILKNMKFDLNSSDFSISSGLSGIGMVFLSFFSITNENIFKIKSISIADKIIDNINYKKLESQDSGLLTGWTGVSLFLFKLGKYFKINKYKKYAAKIITIILNSNTVEYNEDSLLLKDNSSDIDRILPYLSNGSSGLALTLMEMENNEYLKNTDIKNYLNKLIQSGFSPFTVFGGLLTGYSGFIVLGNNVNKKFKNNNLLKYSIRGLNSFLLQQKDELLLPSDIGYKCSMDFSLGSSGLLLSLIDINSKNCNSWFPVPNDSKIKFL